MYYGIVTASVLMFALQFLFSDRYEKESGNGADATFFYSLFSASAGIPCLFIIGGFKLSVTGFTLAVAAVAAVNLMLFSFCSLKALGKINLSLYSLFSMLGGMMLPFLAGLLFYNEVLTAGKIVCVAFVIAALLLTVKRGKSNGGIYYLGVFVLNGMSGVIAKFFESAPFDKTESSVYSLWIAVLTAVFAGTVLIFMRKKAKKPTKKAAVFAFGGGLLNQTANYLLLIALAVLPASVQYPFVTGGVMIASTLISALTGQKPSRREICAVALSFAGVLALVIL